MSKVGRELLFQLTDPGKCFWMSGWFSSSHQQTKVRLPDFMRKALSSQSMHPVEYKKIGEARIKIFSMLSKRELKYRNEIDNLILQMNDTSFVLDESLVQKLILRLVAVNYLWEKVFCNQLISSEDLTKKMEHLFGKAIFETRNLMHSSLKDIIKEIEQLVPSKTSCMTVENSLLKERGLRISKHI